MTQATSEPYQKYSFTSTDYDLHDDVDIHDNSIYKLLEHYAFAISILACISGYVFAMAFTDVFFVRVITAAFWGYTTYLIEMLMLKLKHEDNVLKNIMPVVFRIALSLFASLNITDSLISNLFYVDSIEHILKQDANEKRKLTVSALESKFQTVNSDYASKLTNLNEHKVCLTMLYRIEKSPANTFVQQVKTNSGRVCGVTSGEGGNCGDDCKQIAKELDTTVADIKSLNAIFNRSLGTIEQEIAQIKADDSFPNDKPARDQALEKLKNESQAVKSSHFYLVGFLIFLESLIVVTKLVMPKSTRDHIFDIKADSFVKKYQEHSDLKDKFDNKIFQAEFDYQAEQNGSILTIRTANANLKRILDELDHGYDTLSAFRSKKLKRIHPLNFSARRSTLEKFNEIDELYDKVRAKVLDEYEKNLGGVS